jgi:hypothetical protein
VFARLRRKLIKRRGLIFDNNTPTEKRGVPQGARLVQSCSAIRKVEKPTETVFDGEVDEHNRIN